MRALADVPAVTLSLKVAPELRDAIDEWRAERGLSRSEASRVLLERGLAAPDAPRSKPRRRRGRRDSEATSSCTHPVTRRIGTTCMACGQVVKPTR